MGVQVGRLDAQMATLVLMSTLILTMINVGFHGGVIIITAALDPMCGASNEWFCSSTDFDMSNAQQIVLPKLGRSAATCQPAFTMRHPRRPTILVAYIHSSCADASDPNCGDCLTRATQIMREYCPGKDGAQYGTEECCARYEKNRFC